MWMAIRRSRRPSRNVNAPVNLVRGAVVEAAKRRRSEVRDVPRQIRPWSSRPNDHPAICYHSLMPMGQTWDPAIYARNARFVSDLGTPVVELLAPKPDERILDLGCGDGVL